MSNPHSAVPSALGYYYQGMYALLALLDAAEHQAVSIETDDDVVLHGRNPTLVQLKHRLSDPPKLTTRSTDLWKSIAIWAKLPRGDVRRCLLATTADVAEDSSLRELLPSALSRDIVEFELLDEANRVHDTRKQQAQANQALSFADRAAGCEAYRKLTPELRKSLVARISILPGSLTIDDIPSEVAARISALIGSAASDSIAERLIEWWDRRVVLSFLGDLPRVIEKSEIQSKIVECIIETGTSRLPDHFSSATPDSLDQELGGMMERQIRLVRGGESRIMRAARARWRARNQRERWLSDDAAMASKIHDYDQHLIEQWEDRFHPMCEDCEAIDDDGKCASGLSLLEWTHLKAPSDLRPIHEDWPHDYIVQGTYQQMAEEMQVGWHPKFKDLLSGEENAEESD